MGKPIAEGKSSRTLTIRVNEAQLDTIKKQAEKKQISQAHYLLGLVEKDIEIKNDNDV